MSVCKLRSRIRNTLHTALPRWFTSHCPDASVTEKELFIGPIEHRHIALGSHQEHGETGKLKSRRS